MVRGISQKIGIVSSNFIEIAIGANPIPRLMANERCEQLGVEKRCVPSDAPFFLDGADLREGLFKVVR